MNQIWRRGVAAALAIILALAATLLVPVAAEAQEAEDPPVSCIFHVFAQFDCETVRLGAMTDMVSALESYASENGTYWVEDSGFKGRGTGWTYWEEAGSTYPTAIATVLTDEGHLAADARRDPLWNSGDIEGDLLVYRCQDRVAVFTRHSSEEPSPNDSEWWATNDCTTYPFTGLNATNFRLSMPLAHTTALSSEDEMLRLQAVADMVTAFESYAAANGTYRVDDTGFKGRGSGWTYWEEVGSTYPVAIATVLADEGHLPADAARDPLWHSVTAIEGDLLTYRCKDRVAVFTRHSTTETSPSDSGWWASNGCTTYPIDRLNATHFQLSARLSDI